MRVCVCFGAQQKAQAEAKRRKTTSQKRWQKVGKGLASPPPHLALPWLGWQMWNLWRAGQTHSTARTDVPSWQVMLARPLYIPTPPSPPPAAHAYRLPPSAMYVCVCWQVLGFLFVCHRAHFDVIWCCYARKNACTHIRSTMSVCMCVCVWVAACHIALFAGRRQCKWGGGGPHVCTWTTCHELLSLRPHSQRLNKQKCYRSYKKTQLQIPCKRRG